MFRRTVEHVPVCDYDFGAEFDYPLQSFRSRSCLGYNCYVGLIFKQASQALPKEHQVMHQGASDVPIFVDLCVGTHWYSSGPERI
ncbi:MAG: hypothetical protein WA485_07425 [Candidatus Sulfotelmatobacter sp.]